MKILIYLFFSVVFLGWLYADEIQAALNNEDDEQEEWFND